jgi:hypothetical protein
LRLVLSAAIRIGATTKKGPDHYRIAREEAANYNQVRTHLSLDKNAPDFRRSQKLGPIAAISILGGLHHQYVRV